MLYTQHKKPKALLWQNLSKEIQSSQIFIKIKKSLLLFFKIKKKKIITGIMIRCML